MAEIFIRQLIDDLDGKPIDTGLRHEVTFSYQGADYRIDLRPANADKIESVFAPYIKVAEKVSSAGKVRAKPRLRPGRRRVLVDLVGPHLVRHSLSENQCV